MVVLLRCMQCLVLALGVPLTSLPTMSTIGPHFRIPQIPTKCRELCCRSINVSIDLVSSPLLVNLIMTTSHAPLQ